MNFFKQSRKIESKINCLDGRTKEARLLKKQLIVLWQNASEKDLSNYALMSMIVDTQVMDFLKGDLTCFQKVFRRYMDKLKIAEKIKKYYSSK